MKRVGFVINSRVPGEFLERWREGMPPWAMVVGWDDRGSPMSFMRFRWVAEAVGEMEVGVWYELYRPWQKYDAVVFLKSMGERCEALAERLQAAGTRVIFEANVDYYSEPVGGVRLDVMAPTAEQRTAAVAMTGRADTVIASSRHLAGICGQWNERTAWVPDNVNLRLVPRTVQRQPVRDGRLQVWWSGMAAKAFELLAAGEALLALRRRVHLNLVTDSLDAAREGWPEDVRERFAGLLAAVPHTVHGFRGVADLLGRYGRGGVIVSPRFLDSPYNLAHTEWKISLGMACGMPAVASPVPSYRDVAVFADEPVVTLCEDGGEWATVLEEFLLRPEELRERGRAAAMVVGREYSSTVVARKHLAVVGGVF